MRIILSNNIRLYGAPLKIKNELERSLTIENPKWHENEKMGRWNREPRYLKYYDEKNDIIPRGFKEDFLWICDSLNIPFKIKDDRNTLSEIDFSFKGKPRPYQATACQEMLKSNQGFLQAPTGSGKTFCGLYIAHKRKQPTLILVHTKELLYQWKERINDFFDIDKIGQLGDGKKKIEKITVGMIQTVYGMLDVLPEHFGHLIVDECHRVPSRLFAQAVVRFDCKYVLGLSATPYRRDGLTKLIYWFIGPKRYEIPIEEMRNKKAITEVDIVFKNTDFLTRLNASDNYAKVIKLITEDEKRNNMIAADAIMESKNGTALILSDRKKHCEEIKNIILSCGVECSSLTGDMKRKDREQVVKNINAGQIKIVVATGQLIGEGFDCKNLYCLLLATPIRFNGRLLQYLGRVLRPSKGKEKAKVYDYIDRYVPQLRASAKARRKVYEEEFNYKGD